MTSPNPALAIRSTLQPKTSTRRAAGWLRYLIFGRAVPTVIFALSAVAVLETRVGPAIQRAVEHPDVTSVARAVQVATYLLFSILPVVLYLSRPAPQARDGSIPARAAGFLAITFMLFIPLLGVPGGAMLYRSPLLDATVGLVLTMGAWAFAVVALLFLRHNISVIPEARSLVITGPYRIVRHPLYLAEIVAAAGALFGELRVRSLVALGVLIALQIMRTVYEERLLTRVFPEYREYAARTKRLVPRIW